CRTEAASRKPSARCRREMPCWSSRAVSPWLFQCSFVAQSARRLGTSGTPRRVQRREATQAERREADLQHVGPLHARRQVAHVIDLCIHEMDAEQTLQPVNERLQVE